MKSLVHSINKKIPHRKVLLFSDKLRNHSSKNISLPLSLTSWSALQAGIWQDVYFLSPSEIFSSSNNLGTIIRSIHYKRLKYGWNKEELSELVKSKTFLSFRHNAIFATIVASLLLEAKEFDKCSRLLKDIVQRNSNATIDRYLALSVFAANQQICKPTYNENVTKGMRILVSRFQYFSSLISSELRGKSVALVGNASSEQGQENGKHIDSHDHVIRCNNFSTNNIYAEDY
jgi:hypothetical protein